MNRIFRVIRAKARWLRCKIDPVEYARSLGAKVGENVYFYGASAGTFSTEPWLISIGNNVHVAAGTQFITHDGGTTIIKNEVPGFVVTGRIDVGNDVYIGMRTIILPGVKIGNRCIIGCGAVVTKDIPDNSVAAGVPARVIGTVDGYVDKIRDIMAGNNPRYFSDLNVMHSLNPNRQ